MPNKENKITIGLVEDDPFLSSMYSTKLKLEDFVVFSATDGIKGLEMVIKQLPDLVLLDIMMPKMNGFDVLKALKENELTKNIPVILLTNLNQVEDVKRGEKLGAVDYLVKAHQMPSEVVTKIRIALKKSEPAGESVDIRN